MTLKLGKKPAREGAVKLKLADYATELPTPPASFGWDYLIKPDAWGMLGNGPNGGKLAPEGAGDCVFAGGLHETKLWRASARKSTPLSDDCAIRNYEAVTGFDPSDPSTDQGTDMEAAAKYRRKTGLVDADGHRHKVAAYVSVGVDQLAVAAWLFGAVGVGIEFPAFAMTDFDEGKPWDVQRTNAKVEGGHYIPLVGAADGMFRVITWGKSQLVTPKFLAKYVDESLVYLSEEMLTGGHTIDGLNIVQLRDDLKEVTRV